MSDIITRLHGAAIGAAITERDASGALFSEAAAEIAALRAEVERLRGALERFARATVLPTGEVVGLERFWFDEARCALAGGGA